VGAQARFGSSVCRAGPVVYGAVNRLVQNDRWRAENTPDTGTVTIGEPSNWLYVDSKCVNSMGTKLFFEEIADGKT